MRLSLWQSMHHVRRYKRAMSKKRFTREKSFVFHEILKNDDEMSVNVIFISRMSMIDVSERE